VEKFSAIVTTVVAHPRVHPFVVLFVCLPSVKQLKFVVHFLLNKCSVYIFHLSILTISDKGSSAEALGSSAREYSLFVEKVSLCLYPEVGVFVWVGGKSPWDPPTSDRKSILCYCWSTNYPQTWR